MADDAMFRNGVGATSQLEDGTLSHNNATSISTSSIPVPVVMRALGEVQTAAVQIYQTHFKTKERGDLRLLILLQYEGVRVLHTMNKEERNFMVRNNPTLLAACLSNAQRQMADRRGFRHIEDCSISWKPSFIPFHLEYTIVRSDMKCQHLASVTNIRTRDPKQYAENLIPLAKIFFTKPYGSWSPHLPFIWAPAQSSSPEILNPEDSKAQRTIEHGQLIVTRFETVEDMEIATAEATAKLINENKIIPGLLELIFDPGPKKLGPSRPEEVNSDRSLLVAIPPRKTELNTNDRDSSKPEKRDAQGMNDARNGSKKADPNKFNDKKTSSKIARRRKSVGSVKTDNYKGLVEPFRAVPNEIATCTPNETVPQSAYRQEDENNSTKCAEEAVVKPATSKKRTQSRRAKTKVKHPSREPLGEKDDRSDEVECKVSAPSRKPAQDSQSTVYRDSEAIMPPEASAPPRAPECSSHSFISELSLPGPAYVLQTVTSPRKRALEEELSNLISDTIGGNDGTHYYPSEDERLIATALTSNNDSDSTGYSTGTTQSSPTIGGGVQALEWAYATYTDPDQALLEAGVWLWKRPQTYFYPHQVSIKMSNSYVLAPVIVSHESTGTSVPLIEYSGETVHIIPHDEPWEDVRSIECHPDFLPPCKLVEYQACEVAGYYVWRHDRDRLPCRKPDCDALVMDHDPSSVFCLGCGPKSIIRYCSLQHQIEDIGEHLMECGDPSLVMQCVIDHATAPDHFSDKPPEIAERHGIHALKSAELQRLKIYFMNNGGHYTLFDPVTQKPKTLSWPKSDPNWQELDERIERLLNLVFFGTRKHGIIKDVYRLLHELLRSTGEWSEQIQQTLNTQIRNEFKYFENVEWTGRDSLPHGEEGISTIGTQSTTKGVTSWVERMENKYWILRAWRQQHPTEKDWRVRANGYGMTPLEPGKEIYRLGPGWTGWGGREGNSRGPDWVLDQ